MEPTSTLNSISLPRFDTSNHPLLRPSTQILESQREFASLLAQQSDPKITPEQQARTGAEQLVSAALVQPIFKRLRESNNAPPPFAPSQGEKMFGSFLDGAYAERMVKSQNWGLVDQLARRMLAKSQLASPSIEVNA